MLSLKKKMSSVGGSSLIRVMVLAAFSLLASQAQAQLSQNPANSAGWGMKVYNVDTTTYPFVNVYIRTLDGNQNPLRNVTSSNLGLLVKGKTYDPTKGQYRVSTVRQAGVAVRTIFVIDSSRSMQGRPYEEALKSAVRFIAEKSIDDQVAIVETNDSKLGYAIVSGFTSNRGILESRLQNLRPIATNTRLYDTIGGAMQLCRSASSEGSSRNDVVAFASCSLIVFSDGGDSESALRRADLVSAINNQSVTIPIHTLGYTKDDPSLLKNLQVLSEITVGKYFDASEAVGEIQSVVSNLQRISRDDLIVTFRSTVEADGDDYPFKIAIEYPANSGSITYDSGRFEANEALPIPQIEAMVVKINSSMPAEHATNPFVDPKSDKDDAKPAEEEKEEKEEKSFFEKLFD